MRELSLDELYHVNGGGLVDSLIVCIVKMGFYKLIRNNKGKLIKVVTL
jgi:hypothetical protein